jgi:UDP-2,3-diacylglucosamine hydrolase
MAAYFFSDVHLGLGTRLEEREKEQRLLAFLSYILPSTTALYIVGDLFDFWFDYRTVIPKGFHRTLTKLQEFTDRAIPVYYVAGNHDFWIGDYFREEIGITVVFDTIETRVDGKRVYIHHGDGLAEKDLGYRLIKPILRNPWSIRLYRLLHPDIGVRLARGSSRTSRSYTATKDYGEEEGMRRYAQNKIGEGIDIVIMGHRHRPARVEINGGVYINLGDWITFNTYAKLHHGSIELVTWNGGKPHVEAQHQ